MAVNGKNAGRLEGMIDRPRYVVTSELKLFTERRKLTGETHLGSIVGYSEQYDVHSRQHYHAPTATIILGTGPVAVVLQKGNPKS